MLETLLGTCGSSQVYKASELGINSLLPGEQNNVYVFGGVRHLSVIIGRCIVPGPVDG
jgi:hypothetical protein